MLKKNTFYLQFVEFHDNADYTATSFLDSIHVNWKPFRQAIPASTLLV